MENQNYSYTACGLNNVIIKNMPIIEDDHGNKTVHIPKINLLHANITWALIIKESGLLAEELKFVRTEMGLTQAELAERVKKDHQTIGRWERNQSPIDPTAEIIVRLLAAEHLKEIGFIEEVSDHADQVAINMLSRKCVATTGSNSITINAVQDGGYDLVAA